MKVNKLSVKEGVPTQWKHLATRKHQSTMQNCSYVPKLKHHENYAKRMRWKSRMQSCGFSRILEVFLDCLQKVSSWNSNQSQQRTTDLGSTTESSGDSWSRRGTSAGDSGKGDNWSSGLWVRWTSGNFSRSDWAPSGVDGGLATLGLSSLTPGGWSSGLVALVVRARSHGDNGGRNSLSSGRRNWAPSGVDSGLTVLGLSSLTPGGWSSGLVALVVSTRSDSNNSGRGSLSGDWAPSRVDSGLTVLGLSGLTPGGWSSGLVALVVSTRSDSNNSGRGSLSGDWAPSRVDSGLTVLGLSGLTPGGWSSGLVALVVRARSDGDKGGRELSLGHNWAPGRVDDGGVSLGLGGGAPSSWSSGLSTLVVRARGDGDNGRRDAGNGRGNVRARGSSRARGGFRTSSRTRARSRRRRGVWVGDVESQFRAWNGGTSSSLDLGNEVSLVSLLSFDLESLSQSSSRVGSWRLLKVDVEKSSSSSVVQVLGWNLDDSASTCNVVEDLSRLDLSVVSVNKVVLVRRILEVDWERAWDCEWTNTSVQVNNGLLNTVDTASNILSNSSGGDHRGGNNSGELH